MLQLHISKDKEIKKKRVTGFVCIPVYVFVCSLADSSECLCVCVCMDVRVRACVRA